MPSSEIRGPDFWAGRVMHPGNALAVESWAAVVDRPDADETAAEDE